MWFRVNMMLDESERQELERLRLYRRMHEGKALTRAFCELQSLIDSGYDPVISRRAFRIIFDCLNALKEKIE